MEIWNTIENKTWNKSSIIMIGKFDGFHNGHKKILDKLVEISSEHNLSKIVFCINKNKNDLLMSSSEKEEFLEKYNIDLLIESPFNDYIKSMDREKFLKDILLENLSMKAIVAGSAFSFGNGGKGNVKYLVENQNLGFTAYPLDQFVFGDTRVSSTRIKKCIKEGNILEANEMLGYDFSYEGSVVMGNKIGKTIGFPTININIDESKIVPKFGVYEGFLNDKKGILNIGKKPTINSDNKINLEIHLFDFDKEMYGENVKIRLGKFIREEKTFDNIDELKKQILSDINQIKMI